MDDIYFGEVIKEPIGKETINSEYEEQVKIDFIENEINERLKKYDLTYEELEAFIEKYEPERTL